MTILSELERLVDYYNSHEEKQLFVTYVNFVNSTIGYLNNKFPGSQCQYKHIGSLYDEDTCAYRFGSVVYLENGFVRVVGLKADDSSFGEYPDSEYAFKGIVEIVK